MTNETTMQEIFDLADAFRTAREARDDLKERLSAANDALDKAEKQLTDAMAETECSNFTRGGIQFIMTTTTRWSAEKDRKDELYAILHKNGFDHLFSVNHQTLGSFVREQVEETADDSGNTHIPDWLDGLVKSFDDIGITMKSKK